MANYGAVDDDDRERDFDGRYIEEKPLTREQKIRKVVLVGVPILLAILLVGGAAFFLSRDFDHLYPGHQGSGKQAPVRSKPSRTHYSSETTETTSSNNNAATYESEKKSDSDVASGCLAHEKCSGLVGDCCPTPEGTFLACCD